MTDLTRVGERAKLKPLPGKRPHFQRLRQGVFVGYRPPATGEGPGTWIARTHDADAGKYRDKSLGDFGALPGSEMFAAAKRDAEEWAVKVETGGISAERMDTVADACRAYLERKPGSIAEGVFRRHVWGDPIAKVRLDKLRRHHVEAWRKRLEEAPALLSRSKKGERRTKERSASTINRDMVPLRAALRRVLVEGAPNTDAAWQEPLKPIKGANKRRTLYLDRDERKRLLAAAAADIAPFLRAMCMLPLRPGALAGLRVRDFDKRLRTMTVGTDKNGQPRQIHLPVGIAKFLEAQCKGKLPTAWMFTRADGEQWEKDKWKGPVKDAVAAAKLPAGVTAYVLRHCVLTDLVMAGVPLLTVAQIADTSAAMIERHYGHLTAGAAAEALERLAL
jgi:site-specific recombinase XerD